MLASGPVQEGVGANLNYGMYLGSRLLQGEGLTFGPGWVPWERMPGYGFFGALAGLVAGWKTDIFTIGLVSIELHLLFFALASAAFVTAAARVMRPGLAVGAAVLVIFMPNQLANTQADSIMVPCYLLTAAALCLYLDRERRGGLPPLGYHLLVHLSFALWFLMRPEGVVGWAAAVADPVLAIAPLPGAAGGALSRDRALLGCLQAAVHRRVLDDHEHDRRQRLDQPVAGAQQVPLADAGRQLLRVRDPHRRAAPARSGPPTAVLREVARFAATYPVYVAHVALHKFVAFVDVNVVQRHRRAIPRRRLRAAARPGRLAR